MVVFFGVDGVCILSYDGSFGRIGYGTSDGRLWYGVVCDVRF